MCIVYETLMVLPKIYLFLSFEIPIFIIYDQCLFDRYIYYVGEYT